jgi:hypothetical protein
MDEPKYNNRAGRLLAFLERLRKAGTESNHPTHVVWRRAIRPHVQVSHDSGATDDDITEIFEYIGILKETMTDVELDIRESFPDKADLYLRPFPKFRRILIPRNLQQAWAELGQYLTEDGLNVLEVVASLLATEEAIDAEELRNITNAVHKIFQEVNDSDLEEPLKTWLLHLLTAILHTIQLYHIKGAEIFRTSLDGILSETLWQKQRWEEVKKAQPGIIDRLGTVVKTMAELAAKTKRLKLILEKGQQIGMELLEYIKPSEQ